MRRMARIRSVHPDLFIDEAFCALSPHARLLCIGIWTVCDDHGIFEWKPFGMKISLLPVDSVDVPALLDEMVAQNQIKKFEIDGKAYGAVRNFCLYQRPKKLFFKHELPAELRPYVAIDRRKGGSEAPAPAHTAGPPTTSSESKARAVTPQGGNQSATGG